MGGERWLLKYAHGLLGTAWILGYWLIPFSHLGRTDPNSSFSCGQVDRKGQGKERAGKGN